MKIIKIADIALGGLAALALVALLALGNTHSLTASTGHSAAADIEWPAATSPQTSVRAIEWPAGRVAATANTDRP
ncbi:hypothetical protein [Streptomyces violascens]|uniref:hypothetical protein n=1 Tax=Streptomyces violascens TaxID=67381 RepID=UPI003655D2CB